ncbi:cupin domain-containing protein [Salinigranum marinum]|uniref:cupin domain-containing protein n=1 Tax=Salinigranum marinum TaxID=1515595 RepID=UPI003CCCAA9B
MGVQEGEEVSTVDAGECVMKGRGVWHTFWNPGSEPLRFLEIVSPGTFAWYFAEPTRSCPTRPTPTGRPWNDSARSTNGTASRSILAASPR